MAWAWMILLSGILNFFLGMIVWLRDLKNRLNFGFGIFSLSTVALILFDFIFRFHPTLFVLRSSYAFAALIPVTAIIWILEMCHINLQPYRLFSKGLLFVPGIVFFILSYLDGLVVQRIDSLTILGYKGQLGPFFFIYGIYFIFYILAFIVLLYRAQKRTEDRIYKVQLRFVLTGVTLYSITALFCSLILPNFFNVFDYTLLDSPSLIFFVGFTAYAILRLHMFNIKVIATELLVFALSIFILIRTIISENTQDQIINGSLFVAITIIGTFLIRSVIREVQQREKIEKLATDLEIANVRLKELDQAKSEFISLATHQIRGPLTAIKGYASLILEGDYGKVDDGLKDAVDKIFQSSQSLVVLVEDYLNISRIEQGRMKYDLTEGDFGKLIVEVVNELKPTIEKKGLDIRVNIPQDPVMIHVDMGKIKQVVSNLIDNSVKYTPKGGISVNLVKNSQTKKALLSITDTGVGISPNTMAKLFQKFSRAEDASKENILGTGLGLYVAKEMVEAHHGRIWAESEGPGKGSTFKVELDRVSFS